MYCSKYKIKNISKTKAIADIGNIKAEYDRHPFYRNKNNVVHSTVHSEH